MPSEPLSIFVYGHLRGVTRQRLLVAVSEAGGRLVARPSPRVDRVAVCHSVAARALEGAPPLRLPIRSDTGVMSELGLKRWLGLEPSANEEPRAFGVDEIARGSGLTPEMVRCLEAFDVLEPVNTRFGFRDLRSAREARKLLDGGFTLSAIVQAALTLRRSGRGLFDTSLSDSPWGEVMQSAPGRLGRLDGQYELPLQEIYQSVEEIFDKAEEREAATDFAEAERLYRVALAIDRSDPVIAFNLGNVLEATGRFPEAAIYYRLAIGRDPGFAEAWVNLGWIHEQAGETTATEACLRAAVGARLDCREALYGLAMLLTRRERYDEALPLWRSYLGLNLDATDRKRASRLMMLCRIAVASSSQSPSTDALPASSR